MAVIGDIVTVSPEEYIQWVIEAIELQNVDIYTYMAHKLYEVPLEAVNSLLRDAAKSVLYACYFKTQNSEIAKLSEFASVYKRFSEMFPHSEKYELQQMTKYALENRREKRRVSKL